MSNESKAYQQAERILSTAWSQAYAEFNEAFSVPCLTLIHAKRYIRKAYRDYLAS